jgi:hypothetical protein
MCFTKLEREREGGRDRESKGREMASGATAGSCGEEGKWRRGIGEATEQIILV